MPTSPLLPVLAPRRDAPSALPVSLPTIYRAFAIAAFQARRPASSSLQPARSHESVHSLSLGCTIWEPLCQRKRCGLLVMQRETHAAMRYDVAGNCSSKINRGSLSCVSSTRSRQAERSSVARFSPDGAQKTEARSRQCRAREPDGPTAAYLQACRSRTEFAMQDSMRNTDASIHCQSRPS